MSAIDNSKTTEVVYDEVDGTYRITTLSRARRSVREAMSLVRIIIAGFLTYQGTQYLVYTIAIEELLLNAVALEFVITLDELIYQSLAPAHTKRVTSRVIGFRLPTKNWSGIDGRMVLAFALVVGQLVWGIGTYLVPQLTVLENVQGAICGGDRDFVYAVDGMGTVVWGYPPGVLGTVQEFNEKGYAPWKQIAGEHLNINQEAVNSIVEGNGRGTCPSELCYFPGSPTPLSVLERAACCVPFQTKAPSIEYGRYSVQSKSTADVVETTKMCVLSTRAHTVARPSLCCSDRGALVPQNHSYLLPNLCDRVAGGMLAALTFWVAHLRTAI